MVKYCPYLFFPAICDVCFAFRFPTSQKKESVNLSQDGGSAKPLLRLESPRTTVGVLLPCVVSCEICRFPSYIEKQKRLIISLLFF